MALKGTQTYLDIDIHTQSYVSCQSYQSDKNITQRGKQDVNDKHILDRSLKNNQYFLCRFSTNDLK